MRRSFVALLLALAACRTTPSTPPVPLHVEPALSADEPTAEAVGRAVLADGGSAADAAIATLLALGVENPASSGLGGGGFATIWDAGEHRAYALDFREMAPAGASVIHYRRADGEIDKSRLRMGCYAAGVPGEAAGLEALYQRFHKLDWNRLVTPAQKLAAEGVPVTAFLASTIQMEEARLEYVPALHALMSQDGNPLKEGDTLRNPELAATLRILARDGAGAFYRGTIASGIAAACRDLPGAINSEDLASYHARWRAPIIGHWKGYDVVAIPPPSSGGTILVEMLHILEPVPFDRDAADAGPTYHMLVEAMKNGFADRATVFGDPDFTEVPVDELTSRPYADRLRSQIDGTRTHPRGFYGHPGVHTATEDHGTTNVSVVDAEGNAVAITSSVNDHFGSMVIAGQTGVLLNNTMDDFSFPGASNSFGLVGSDKNAVRPGKRPVSSMAPTIMLQDGKVRLVAGGSGGPMITSGVLQIVLGVLAEGKSVDEAVDAPRVHDQWIPDEVMMEPSIPRSVAEELTARGHTLKPFPMLGVIDAVEVKDGRAIAADDPRKRHPPVTAASEASPSPRENGPEH